MSGWLIGLVTVIYMLVAIDFGMRGNWGMCVCFLGYCAANVGLIIAS